MPSQGRLYYIRYALKMGWTIQQVHEATKIDPWFLDQVQQLVQFEDVLCGYQALEDLPREVLFQAKQMGYSDPQLANLYLGRISTDTILNVRARRKELGIEPVYKLVDTCAAEFEAETPYYYSTYESAVHVVGSAEKEDRDLQTICDDEVRISDKKKVIILGGGPNRIGQGIEFDYCCVQAAFAADELGYESVMVNSHPETVSPDYDTSDLLFFEPLTLEDVLNICERLNGGPLGQTGDDGQATGNLHGVIVQFGGQTPLNLANGLEKAGVPIIGTSVDSIDLAEDRERFGALLRRLDIHQPNNGIALNPDQAIEVANRIGYPVLVRPSFVLGGRAMETVFNDEQLKHYMTLALGASDLEDQPILIDKFLSEAIEVDVDVVSDYGRDASGRAGVVDQTVAAEARICGVMEHIEEAGVHSGDSACAIPPHSLPEAVIDRLIDHSKRLAEALAVRGLMNVQYAIARPDTPDGHYEIYVLEVNPRASRTVPFVSKATGISWARVAAKVMIGSALGQLDAPEHFLPAHTSVKESVFPFSKFPGVDVILGPEMRSTGEVMGVDAEFPIAFAKSQMAAGTVLPTEGQVFVSVRDSDKGPMVANAVEGLLKMGFAVYSTPGTCEWLAELGLTVNRLNKISEGRPNAVDMIKNGELNLIVNTPTGKGMNTDEGKLRATAVRYGVPMITTTTGAAAGVRAIRALSEGAWGVRALQDYYTTYRTGAAVP